jgi:hypothetical protein
MDRQAGCTVCGECGSQIGSTVIDLDLARTRGDDRPDIHNDPLVHAHVDTVINETVYTGKRRARLDYLQRHHDDPPSSTSTSSSSSSSSSITRDEQFTVHQKRLVGSTKRAKVSRRARTAETVQKGQDKALSEMINPTTAIESDNGVSDHKTEINGLMVELGIEGNIAIRDRAYELGVQFIAMKTAVRETHKARRAVSAACMQRACEENRIGLRASELMKAVLNVGLKRLKRGQSARIHRYSHWRRVLRESLKLKPLSIPVQLDGCITRITSILPMRPGDEYPMIDALVSYVHFLLYVGARLPPIGPHGEPYLVKGERIHADYGSDAAADDDGDDDNDGIRLAYNYDAKSKTPGVKQRRAKETSDSESTRVTKWVKQVYNTYLIAINPDRCEKPQRHLDEADTLIETKKWIGEMKPGFATEYLSKSPDVIEDVQLRWQLNRSQLSTVAASIIYLVSQQRKRFPRTKKAISLIEKKRLKQINAIIKGKPVNENDDDEDDDGGGGDDSIKDSDEHKTVRMKLHDYNTTFRHTQTDIEKATNCTKLSMKNVIQSMRDALYLLF